MSKTSRGTGKGVGGPAQGIGQPAGCVCPKCGTETAHDPGIPCASKRCPVCGSPMVGKD